MKSPTDVVAYGFKAQFANPIIAGTKRQTLRNDRKRHARPSETIQLSTAMRTKYCRLIGTATCERAEPITLDFARGQITEDGRLCVFQYAELHKFARADGFANWVDLIAFWRKHHPNIGDTWSGVQITWGSSFRLSPGLALADRHTEGTCNV